MQEQAAVQDLVYALNATPDGTTWLAARQSGLQRSTDGGQSWQPVSLDPEQDEQITVTALVTAPGPDNTLHLMAGVVGGIFLSIDGGDSWSPRGLASPAPFLTALACSPDYASDGIAFAASMEDGVFRTADHGQSWRPWTFGLFDLNILGLLVSPGFAQDATVFALTESGLYRSTNRGRAWTLLDFPSEAVPALCLTFSSDQLYAGTEMAGLYVSSDQGDTWQHVAAVDTDDSINAILPGESGVLVLTTDRAWSSSDAGQSWSPCFEQVDFGEGLTTAYAPQSYSAGKPLLIGLADGRILTVTA